MSLGFIIGVVLIWTERWSLLLSFYAVSFFIFIIVVVIVIFNSVGMFT